MRLYLVRHGDALSKAQDPTRPLSEEGRRHVEAVAAAAKRVGVKPAVVAHSDKLRAQQTAQILAEVLDPPQGLRELETFELSPNADPAELEPFLFLEKGDKLIVGHLPQLGRLVDYLLTGRTDHDLVELAAASLVVLEGRDREWRLQALIPPTVLA